ncbi:hypothetical protein D3Z58_04760 [Clostridiaceae bacterium]|nr:hypothetical protein [Clostridiaceae bacterium]
MPPESSRQGHKLLLSLIGAVCAFLATRKIMFHSKYNIQTKFPNTHKAVSFYQIIPAGNKIDKSEK